MANHARDNRNVADKRAALAGSGSTPRAYSHADQVGGTRKRESDGRWVDRDERQETRPTQRQTRQRETIGQFIGRNMTYILPAVAVALIVVLLVFGVRALTAKPDDQGDAQSQATHDWANLRYEGDRCSYVVDGQVKSRLGIDVADYQGDIDWNAVAADGVDFAIIRLGYRGATEGELYLDDYFESNITEAKAAGVDCGVYFFSQAITIEEASEEANFVLQNLGGMKLEYPIAFDWEVVTSLGDTRANDLDIGVKTAIADTFCRRIEAAGYHTLVYGNIHDLQSYDVDILTSRGIWWAEYDVSQPSVNAGISIWQYTSNGSVNGIDNGVDLNLDLTGANS